MSGAVEITDATFRVAIESNAELWVVEFWAPWCMPCLALAPALEQLAQRYAGRARIAKVNVDENPETAALFDIWSIPTLLFFRAGQLQDTIAGLVPRAEIAARIDQHLGSG